MIEFDGLVKGFDGTTVLDGIDLRIGSGETVALLGPSGTGKSLLLKHVIGLYDPDAGDVRVDGISVSRAGRREIDAVRSRISYVFQDSALFDSRTVAENVRIGLGPDARGPWTDRQREAVREALEIVNLDPGVDAAKLPGELSGGMQKRVAIARALVGDHRYMLYDEPTTGLDPINTAVTSDLIRKCHNQDRCETDVLVTHDLVLAFDLADRAVVLAGGRIRAEGRPDEIRRSEDPFVQRFLDARLPAPDRHPEAAGGERVDAGATPPRSGEAERA